MFDPCRRRGGRLTQRRAAFFFAAIVLSGAGRALRGQSPLTLHDAVQQALSGPEARIAEAQTEQARGLAKQAGLGPNPRLYLQSEDLRPWDSNYSFANQTENYGYLGQTLEVAGKRGKRVAFAQARVRQTEAENDAQLRRVAGRVTSAYWNAVSLERVAGLLGEEMAAVDEMVRYEKERVDAGATRGVDLLRMQIERDRLQISLVTARRDAEQAKLELFRQMGRPAGNVTLTDPLELSPAVPPMQADAVLRTRPDAVAAREAVSAAEADLKLQRANAVPDPDLFGGYKRNAADNTAYGGLQLSLPVRNRNQGEIARATAALTAARESLLLLEAQIRVELEQAEKNYKAQQELVGNTLPEMRARAKQNLAIISEAYRIGGIDLLRFIDAERSEFETEATAVRTLGQLQQGAVQLRLAYGVQP